MCVQFPSKKSLEIFLLLTPKCLPLAEGEREKDAIIRPRIRTLTRLIFCSFVFIRTQHHNTRWYEFWGRRNKLPKHYLPMYYVYIRSWLTLLSTCLMLINAMKKESLSVGVREKEQLYSWICAEIFLLLSCLCFFFSAREERGP